MSRTHHPLHHAVMLSTRCLVLLSETLQALEALLFAQRNRAVNRRDQVRWLYRFEEIGISAREQSAELIFLLCHRRQDDKGRARRLRITAYCAHELVAIHTWHLDIDHNTIRADLQIAFKSLRAIFSREDLIVAQQFQ